MVTESPSSASTRADDRTDRIGRAPMVVKNGGSWMWVELPPNVYRSPSALPAIDFQSGPPSNTWP